MTRELDVAARLAREAGALLLGYRRKSLVVGRKPGDEPVTEADRAANALIVEGLGRVFPGDAILSEEVPDDGARHRTRRVWMVDPLDGTKDFLRDEAGFSVMIGLCEGARSVAGVVYHPPTGRLYAAARGQGAFVEERAGAGGAGRRAIRASGVEALGDARLVASKSHRDDLIDRIRVALGVRDELTQGSVGLKIGLIAAGERDLYVNPSARSRLWDVCAADVILAEAGGRVTDTRGAPIDYAAGDLLNRRGLVASNGRLHDAAIDRLRQVLPAPAS